MADSSEPKKETVRIMVSPPASSPKPSSAARSGETVRIHLPSRPPANPSESQSTKPPSPTRAAAVAIPVPMTMHAPKKATACIPVSPDPPAKPAVEMKKTQPLIVLPAVEAPATGVTVAPKTEPQPVSKIDQMPVSLCWGLLGASAAILILQIWNYL